PALPSAVVAAAWVRFTTFGTATDDGPDDTTRATALPGATSVPAAGFSLMTEPAGTVVLAALLTVPTVRPALPSAVVAAAWVRFTTFGTATGAPPGVNTIVGSKPVASQLLLPSGPWLIVKFTPSPCTTVVVRSKPIPAVLPLANVCCHSTVAFFAMETLTPPPHPALTSRAVPVIRTEPACGATHRRIASAKLPGCPPLFQRSRYGSLPCHCPLTESN